jgi:hypothetical protein
MFTSENLQERGIVSDHGLMHAAWTCIFLWWISTKEIGAYHYDAGCTHILLIFEKRDSPKHDSL